MGFSAVRARAKVEALREADRRRLAVEFEQFRLAAEFADEYRWVPDDGQVLEGTERLLQWGGEGTPEVAEFCSLEFAAALRMSEESARLLLRDALAIRGRFPGVWAALDEGRLRVWQARHISAATVDLSLVQCTELDAELAMLVDGLSWRRLEQLVRARVMTLRGDREQDDYERRRGSRNVRFRESFGGVVDVEARLDAADGVFLDAALDRLAGILALGGSTEAREVRRAMALGVLASPARALQLVQAALTDELPEIDAECPARGQRGHTCGSVTVPPEELLPKADLVVHLTDESVGSGQGLARVEGVGPILTGWVKDLVAHTSVVVRPVLDPRMLSASDAYECPPRMREWVTVRNGHEVFPHSSRPSRRLDMDHTRRFIRGAKRQTRPDNLGPLSRKAHRAKTHGGWRCWQVEPGVFIWESPLGYRYVVSPSGTHSVEEVAVSA